jgi:hypothetical protein
MAEIETDQINHFQYKSDLSLLSKTMPGLLAKPNSRRARAKPIKGHLQGERERERGDEVGAKEFATTFDTPCLMVQVPRLLV